MRKRLTTQRMAALASALLLVLVMAVPAAANSKVVIDSWDDGFEYPVNQGDPWISDCSFDDEKDAWVCEAWACGDETIRYGGTAKGSVTLWYPKSVDPADYMPDGEAWPWKQGRVENQGLDYFSTGADKTGKVVSGKYRFTVQLRNHHLGGPDYVADPETWTEQLTGKSWGIKAPGKGPVFFEAGNLRSKVTHENPGTEMEPDFEELRPWKGNQTFDAEGVCEYFGYGYKELTVEFPA